MFVVFSYKLLFAALCIHKQLPSRPCHTNRSRKGGALQGRVVESEALNQVENYSSRVKEVSKERSLD